MSYLQQLSQDFLSWHPALIGAISGASLSILIQFFIFRYRLFMAFKRFKRDVENLDRHISASLLSLDIDPDAPKYFIAARLRFCKFLSGMKSLDELEWLTQRRDSKRVLPTLLAIRNSDIFLDEIANRIDEMHRGEIEHALSEAKLNLKYLHVAIEKLGYIKIGTLENVVASSQDNLRTLRERKELS